MPTWMSSATSITACQIVYGCLLQHDISKTLQIAQDVLHLDKLRHETEEVPDQEWVNAMKVYFHSSLTCFYSAWHSVQVMCIVAFAVCMRRRSCDPFSYLTAVRISASDDCDSGHTGRLLFCNTSRCTMCMLSCKPVGPILDCTPPALKQDLTTPSPSFPACISASSAVFYTNPMLINYYTVWYQSYIGAVRRKRLCSQVLFITTEAACDLQFCDLQASVVCAEQLPANRGMQGPVDCAGLV